MTALLFERTIKPAAINSSEMFFLLYLNGILIQSIPGMSLRPQEIVSTFVETLRLL